MLLCNLASLLSLREYAQGYVDISSRSCDSGAFSPSPSPGDQAHARLSYALFSPFHRAGTEDCRSILFRLNYFRAMIAVPVEHVGPSHLIDLELVTSVFKAD